MSTAAENRAISSSVSCREHKLLAKSNTALTNSSHPGREKRTPTKKGLLRWFQPIFKVCGEFLLDRCTILPRALNICMPPYFPSKRTVLLRGLKARHIRTRTTSKQPVRGDGTLKPAAHLCLDSGHSEAARALTTCTF